MVQRKSTCTSLNFRISSKLERKYSHLHDAVVDRMSIYESGKGNLVDVMEKSTGYDLKVNGVKIRIFVSNHKGGILKEDGVAISVKGFSSMSNKDVIRVVSIPDRKYMDYCLKDFTFKHRPEPQLRSTLYARMTKEQRRVLMKKGIAFEFTWV